MAGLTKIIKGAINGITIDSSQNVGIGTSSPQKPLHVAGTGEQVRIQDSTNSGSNADIQLALYDSSSTRLGYISKFSSDFYIVNQENADTIFYTNNLERMRIDSNGHVLPSTTNNYDLGSSSLVWRNIYTSDFHMSNEGLDKGNDIDGTKGSWTFQEGEENLYLINNKNGKKYKFNLTEIE